MQNLSLPAKLVSRTKRRRPVRVQGVRRLGPRVPDNTGRSRAFRKPTEPGHAPEIPAVANANPFLHGAQSLGRREFEYTASVGKQFAAQIELFSSHHNADVVVAEPSTDQDRIAVVDLINAEIAIVGFQSDPDGG